MKRLIVFGSLFFALAALPAGAAAPMESLPPQPKVRPAGLPAGVVMVSPCIATMGEHWVDPKGSMMGPIYGSYNGKVIFTEIMVPLSELQKGFSWANIRALPGYTIDHMDFKFEAKGHPGMTVPHYDVHLYYVSPAFQKTICPDGIPDPAMKPTNLSAHQR